MIQTGFTDQVLMAKGTPREEALLASRPLLGLYLAYSPSTDMKFLNST